MLVRCAVQRHRPFNTMSEGLVLKKKREIQSSERDQIMNENDEGKVERRGNYYAQRPMSFFSNLQT